MDGSRLTPGPARQGPSARLRAGAARALLAVLGRLPARPTLAVAAAFGRAWVRLGGPRTDVGLVNLRIAFPEWSEARRRRVLAQSVANLARGVVEFAQLGRLGPEALRERVRVEGLENLEAVRAGAPGRGIVVITAHFGSWELLSAAMTAHGYPITVVHRARDEEGLDRLVASQREAGGSELLPRGGAARGALAALRDGRFLAMPYDQNCDRDEGVFVPFFGRLACTRSAPARVALRTRSAVLPVFLFREADGVHHVARVYPAVLLPESGGDRRGDAAVLAGRMTAAVEAAIREAPAEWSWVHRRWRTQPPGEPRPYPSSRRRPALQT